MKLRSERLPRAFSLTVAIMVGLVVLVTSVSLMPVGTGLVGDLLQYFGYWGDMPDDDLVFSISIGPLMLLTYLVARTVFLRLRWRLLKPDGRYCGDCGYDLTGNTSGLCSECGKPVEQVEPVAAPRRKRSRLPRALRIGGLGACAIVFLTWLLSLPWIFAIYGPVLNRGWFVGLGAGRISLSLFEPGTKPSEHVEMTCTSLEKAVGCRERCGFIIPFRYSTTVGLDQPLAESFDLPLWVPFVVVGLPTCLATWWNRRRRKSAAAETADSGE